MANSKSWKAAHPSVSYSESQERRRRQCERAHYHSVFTAHKGWEAEPQSDSWRAYRVKKAVPLSAAVGTAVHEAANLCVEAIKAGQPLPSFETLRAAAAASLNNRWRNSRRNLDAFMRSPTRVPVYLESLYGDGPTRGELFRANHTLDRALSGLVQCDIVWNWVRTAVPADVIVMDPFTSVQVATADGNTTCYGAADLIVRPESDAPWHIIDFKSGSADGVVDQILTYTLIARDSLKLSIAEGYIGVIVALGEHPKDAVSMFAVSAADLADASERLQQNIGKLRSLLADQSSGAPLPMDEFRKTANPRTCSWCAFRALCHPDQLDSSAVIGPPAPALAPAA